MIYLISFATFLVVVVLMAIGVILKRQTIQGSGGGLASIEMERECNCVETCDEHARVLHPIQEPQASDC
ncbi:(Na+)-NQR maturation NqrM [Vibrio sp. YMD68]|uniref:(Na+)-NQR maturation NqrM n=1 Tax=Vibrio sp. YMD68 TaxID=3042300 RepID=UPI00249A763C|nr:(Na+)-NQR maturation NqrM [Vibrio sp. YMD68]WGV98525.1 (Na+)-NQR maturation NqrM [Vibrio sp. YMD68]